MNLDELSLSAVLDAIDAAVFIVQDMVILRANVAAMRLTGYPMDALGGMPLKALIHPDYAASVHANLETLVPFEIRLLTADQTPVWVRWTPKRIVWREQPAWIMTLVMIEDRKQLESELRHQRQLYRAFFEQSNDGVHLINLDAQIIGANQRAAELYRLPVEAMIGHSIYDFIAEDEYPDVDASGPKLLQAGQLPIFERRLRRGDGTIFPAEVNLVMVYDDEGQPRYSHSVVRDISERKAMEDKLRENEERLLSTLSSLDDLVFVLDREGFYRDYYQPDRGKLFVPPEAFLGKRIDQIGAPPEMAELCFKAITALETSETVQSFDYHLPFKGETAWFNAKISRLKNAQGEFSGVTVVVRDVTERKKAEEELRQSEESYRLLAENIIDVVVMTDQNGQVKYVSPSVERVLGYQSAEFENQFGWEAVHPDDLPAIMQSLQGMDKDEAYRPAEFRVQHKAGTYIWFESQGTLIRESATGGISTISVLRNITERKRMAERLAESEAMFRGMFESAAVGVAITALDGTISYANPTFERMLGYTLDELFELSWRDITHPEDRTLEEPLIAQLLAGEIPYYQLEKRYIRADKQALWIRITVSVLRDSDGSIHYTMAIVEDISERKRMEQALIEEEVLRGAFEKEQELSNLKTQMMIRISHEFRTPLSIILSASELLEQYYGRLSPEKRQERFESVRVQIQHLARMLDDISLIIRGMAGPSSFRPVIIDLETLCTALVEEVRQRESAHQPITLQIENPALISGDEQSVRMIIRNLISNALKYSSADSEVRVEVKSSEAGGAIVRVVDSGIGIPPEEVAHIFEPFYRASNVGETPGLGIGLGVVRDMVEQHQGTIEVESEPGIGTTFTVWLPFVMQGSH
ncbi:MAG: PAS domain S-box protein [Anaerolineae bacterium]|nr:PAS domain S-box protein [Anaerolineae bacterium]